LCPSDTFRIALHPAGTTTLHTSAKTLPSNESTTRCQQNASFHRNRNNRFQHNPSCNLSPTTMSFDSHIHENFLIQFSMSSPLGDPLGKLNKFSYLVMPRLRSELRPKGSILSHFGINSTPNVVSLSRKCNKHRAMAYKHFSIAPCVGLTCH